MRALSLAAALLAATLSAAFAEEPVAGLWKTQPDDNGRYGHVRIAPCGPALCGVIAAAFEADGRPRVSDTVGKRMIWDMTPRGAGSYRGGRIWAPDRDKTYNGRMQLDGDRLEVSGCVLGICRGQVWTRLE